MLEKRMVNGHRHDRLDLDDYFTTITIESESASSVGGGVSYIQHQVSKFDTLAGVAIKYGVEVSDIKKMNGLVTDHQMFALKTLHIPLPGRHPPSPILANGVDNKRPSSSERAPPGRRHSDLFDSFQSPRLNSSSQHNVSPARSASRGYYGLSNSAEKIHPEGFEMSAYNKEGSLEDGTLTKPATPSILPLSLPRKCKSAANGFYSDNGNLATQEAKDNDWGGRWIEKFLQRRPKSEIDLKSSARDTLLKEENNNSGGIFSALASKGLALRPKSGNRNGSEIDVEGGASSFLVDPLLADRNFVRKSSSSPSFQESDNGSTSTSLSSIWPTSKWSLKPDFQSLSSAVITKPIFDGLPLPVSVRKSKAAID
ncbi:hypothetical protein Leryth_025785 [Lithospermum erythrorhizon]|nr:hypothetical protein Leryth_025785 [Lithospermum erythrorhizon]